MPSIVFHKKKNIGRDVKINGKMETILSVARDGLTFRIESEKNGPVVRDYDCRHIQDAVSLTLSMNEGETWFDAPFMHDA